MDVNFASVVTSATDMVYRLMVQMDSTRWWHYIEMGPCISSNIAENVDRYMKSLNIVRD